MRHFGASETTLFFNTYKIADAFVLNLSQPMVDDDYWDILFKQ